MFNMCIYIYIIIYIHIYVYSIFIYIHVYISQHLVFHKEISQNRKLRTLHIVFQKYFFRALKPGPNASFWSVVLTIWRDFIVRGWKRLPAVDVACVGWGRYVAYVVSRSILYNFVSPSQSDRGSVSFIEHNVAAHSHFHVWFSLCHV